MGWFQRRKVVLIKEIFDDRQGFTLVETLLVLAALFVMLSSAAVHHPDYGEKREIKTFMEQFSRDFHLAQMYAFNRQSIVYFRLDFEKQTYTAVDPVNSNRLFTRKLPPTIKMRGSTLDGQVYYTGNGHVSKAGSWTFHSKKYNYKFTVLVGRGRHYFSEY